MKKETSYFERIAQSMDLPLSIIAKVPRIELTGNTSLLIEQHMGIIKYTDDEVVVAAHNMSIKIAGSKLSLGVMNSQELTINGNIVSVSMESGGEM